MVKALPRAKSTRSVSESSFNACSNRAIAAVEAFGVDLEQYFYRVAGPF